MTHKEAEKIVRRDLPTLIVGLFATMPVSPTPEEIAGLVESMIPRLVEGILHGTVPLTSEQRLTGKVGGFASNLPNPREN
jgi:hypothetical protein